MSVHLLEASREKQTMAEVAVTEKLVAEISEKPKEDGAAGEAKDDVLPPEAGGKTLTFLTTGGEAVVVSVQGRFEINDASKSGVIFRVPPRRGRVF